jgi:hypothetical protein
LKNKALRKRGGGDDQRKVRPWQLQPKQADQDEVSKVDDHRPRLGG